jgi:hypothetical protein
VNIVLVMPWPGSDGRGGWGYRAWVLQWPRAGRTKWGVRGPLPFVLGVLSRVAHREVGS